MAKRKKQTKTRARREILLRYSEGAFDEHYIFYTNGQYRMRGWIQGDYSEWRIVDGQFMYKHAGDNDFDFDDEDCSALVAAIEKAKLDLAFEKQVLI